MRPQLLEQAFEDERTQIIMWPFVGFSDDDMLDANSALISRMILVLQKRARIREAARCLVTQFAGAFS